MAVKGLVLYDKQLNGFLNGVFANDDSKNGGRIFTETARPNPDRMCENGGDWYEVFYFDGNNGKTSGELNLYKNSNNMYIAEWFVGGNIVFKGFGFDMNERQIALSYESA